MDAAPDPFESSAPSASRSAPAGRRRLVRLGAVILLAGFLTALVAAAVVAQGRASWESTATVVHRAGQLIMLVGLLLALLGYRLQWLTDIQRRWAANARKTVERMTGSLSDTPGGDTIVVATEFSEQEETNMNRPPLHPPPVSDNAVIVSFGLAGSLLLAMVLTAVLPASLSALLILLVSMSVPVCLLVLTVYGTTLQRTFCLGAWFPAGLMMIQMMSLVFSLNLLMGRMQFVEFARFLDAIGSNYRWMHATIWALVLVMGSLAVVIRLMLAPPPKKDS